MATRIKTSSIETKMSIFETHILPFLGKLPVNEISPAAIRSWQSELMSATKTNKSGEKVPKYSQPYLRTIHAQMSSIMNYAIKYYALDKNPCLAAGSMGKKRTHEMRFWTDAQFNLAIEYCTNPAKKLALKIMFWCGLRVGECLALRPVDISDGSIRVDKTFVRKDGEDDKTAPKTDNSYRIVTAPDFLLADIEDYTSRLYGLQPEDRILYFGKGTLNKELDRIATAAGLPRIRIHDLRHSHAAELIDMGYSISAVAKRLGDTEETVMSTYAHLYPTIQDQIVGDLEKRQNCITKKEKAHNDAPSQP
jgi:integrase